MEIIGYEGLYEINENGEVFRLPRYYNTKNGLRYYNKKRVQPTTKFGGQQVVLTKDGKRTWYQLKYLVALHYIPNPNNYNHTMYIKSTGDNINIPINIKWVSESEYLENFKNNRYKSIDISR